MFTRQSKPPQPGDHTRSPDDQERVKDEPGIFETLPGTQLAEIMLCFMIFHDSCYLSTACSNDAVDYQEVQKNRKDAEIAAGDNFPARKLDVFTGYTFLLPQM